MITAKFMINAALRVHVAASDLNEQASQSLLDLALGVDGHDDPLVARDGYGGVA